MACWWYGILSDRVSPVRHRRCSQPIVATTVERAAAGDRDVGGQVDRDQTLEVAQVEGPHLGVLAGRRFERREAAFEAQLDVVEAVERRVGHHHKSLPGRHDDRIALARGAHRVVEGFAVQHGARGVRFAFPQLTAHARARGGRAARDGPDRLGPEVDD